MDLIVQNTTTLLGKVTAPSSKSQSIRGLLFALLAHGKSTLSNILESDDTRDAINVCKHFGMNLNIHDGKYIIESTGAPLQADTTTINSGNSGITTHFVMPILGLRQNAQQPIILDCGEQMRLRIIKPLVETLRQLGLSIRYLKNEGSCPLEISGNLTGGIASISGITSQYLSALLISLPCALNDSEISVQDLMERSYVDLTIEWLKKQGITFTHQQNDNVDIYKIKGGQRYKQFNASISGDFSSASYLIAAAVLTQSNIELVGLDMQDQQGDKILVTILQEMGADIVVEPSRLIIRGGKTLKGLKIDATDIPDLLPTLAVIGTYAEGKTEIYNAHHARIKETDRIHSMREGLERLGARTEEHHDNLTIYQSKLKGAHVKGYGDHRTVMALALAGMLAEGETIIDEGESISKTFPTFVVVMQSLGAKMKLVS